MSGAQALAAAAPEGLSVVAAMATPAVLLLANAMLILSTIQRIQAILQRLRESEESIRAARQGHAAPDPGEMRDELELHGRRVGLAHRALLSFYASAAVLLFMIGSVGAAGIGWAPATDISLLAAFLGALLLLLGAALLAVETWMGVHATDARVRSVLAMFDVGDDGGSSGGSMA